MYLDINFIKNVLSQLPAAIYFKDINCRYLFSSQYSDMLTGNDDVSKTVVGKTDIELYNNSSNAVLSYETDKKIISGGSGISYIIEEILGGEVCYFEIVKNPVRNKNGKIIGIVGLTINITDKVKAKQNLNTYSFIDTMTGLYSKKGFISNLYKKLSSADASKTSAIAAIISYIPDEHTQLDFSGTIYLANALRVPITENKVCARIEQNVFAVLMLHDSSETHEKCFMSLMSSLKSSLGKYTSGIVGFKLPELVIEYTALPVSDPEKAERKFEKLFGEITRNILSGKNSFVTYKKEIYKLRSSIYDNPEKNWNIADIAADIGVSKSHFFRMYKKLCFTSCTDDIIDARLKKACDLLQYTDMHVGEIASRCGYRSESFFMRQFRGKIGVTAIQYRRKYKN